MLFSHNNVFKAGNIKNQMKQELIDLIAEKVLSDKMNLRDTIKYVYNLSPNKKRKYETKAKKKELEF